MRRRPPVVNRDGGAGVAAPDEEGPPLPHSLLTLLAACGGAPSEAARSTQPAEWRQRRPPLGLWPAGESGPARHAAPVAAPVVASRCIGGGGAVAVAVTVAVAAVAVATTAAEMVTVARGGSTGGGGSGGGAGGTTVIGAGRPPLRRGVVTRSRLARATAPAGAPLVGRVPTPPATAGVPVVPEGAAGNMGGPGGGGSAPALRWGGGECERLPPPAARHGRRGVGRGVAVAGGAHAGGGRACDGCVGGGGARRPPACWHQLRWVWSMRWAGDGFASW